MKKFLYVAIVISGIYGVNEAMVKGSPYISYRSTRGEFVERRLADVDERTFQDMSPSSFEQIARLLQSYQQFVSHPISLPLEKPKTTDLFSKLRSSIASDETQFLNGTEKDWNFLLAGYSKLGSLLNDKALEKLDENLRAVFAASKDTSACRRLAESYKELALSSTQDDDFIRAAFWFRMLYTSGEHSSYLDEYDNMISKITVM